MKSLLTVILSALLTAGWAQKKATVADPKLLIGRWRSVDDKNVRITFTVDTETEYYEKSVMSVSTYSLKKDQLTAKDKESGEVYRYAILQLDAKSLSLLYLDRGNTLRYKKE